MSDTGEQWRMARAKYLGVMAEDAARIVAEARRDVEGLRAVGAKIEFREYRRGDGSPDARWELLATIVWLADELEKRPALTVHLDPRADACAAPCTSVIVGAR